MLPTSMRLKLLQFLMSVTANASVVSGYGMLAVDKVSAQELTDNYACKKIIGSLQVG